MFSFQFHLYGLLIGIAIVVAFQLVEHLLYQQNVKVNTSLLAFFILLFGLIGARVYHLITDWQLYLNADVLDLIAIWNGGIGIIGGLIGGVFGLWIALKIQRKKKYFFVVLDAIALALPFSQSIGRWGNYFNQELYGEMTTLPWGIQIDSDHLPVGANPHAYYHPLFLYESILLFVFGILYYRWYQHKRFGKLGSGKYLAIYGMTYALMRFFLEFLRFESAHIVGVTFLTTAQLMTIGLFLISMVLFFGKVEQKVKE